MDFKHTRRLGGAPLELTQLGFGGAPLGDLYAKLPEEEAIATVHTAYEAGIRMFDTSPLYGHGLSEHRLGHVLRQYPRDSFRAFNQSWARSKAAGPTPYRPGKMAQLSTGRTLYPFGAGGA